MKAPFLLLFLLGCINLAIADEGPGYTNSGEIYSYDLTGVKPAPPPNLLFLGDFETGEILPATSNVNGFLIQPEWIEDTVGIVTSPTRSGNYAAKIILRRSDWPPPPGIQQDYKPRAQLVKSANYMPLRQEREYWIGWSNYFPTDWPEDSYDNNIQVMQIKGIGDISGPSVLSNNFNLGRFFSRVRYGKYGDLNEDIPYDVASSSIPKKQWVDWVVRVVLSTGNTGIFEMWRDGTKVVSRLNKPNMYWGVNGKPRDLKDRLQLSMMLYKPKYITKDSDATKYSLYFDEIRVVQGPNGYKAVSPATYSR